MNRTMQEPKGIHMAIILYDLVGKDTSRPFSPHCWKTKMMLAHLGMEWEEVPATFTGRALVEGGKAPSFPTIRDGDLVLADSFNIAKHYASGKKLMGGSDGEAMCKFIECWSQSQLHSWIAGWAMMDIMQLLDEEDQAFFRARREKMFGKTLEEIVADRQDTIPELVKRLSPMKMMLAGNKFIGGEEANFADYIVFGAFQWLRLVSGLQMIPQDHVAMDWMSRCLDLHDGLGASVSEAAPT